MDDFLSKNPPYPPFTKRGGYRLILSVYTQLILNSFMNAYLTLQGQTFSSLTGQTSGLPILELLHSYNLWLYIKDSFYH